MLGPDTALAAHPSARRHPITTHADSIIWSWVGLPDELKYAFGRWNSMTHGNITFVVFLLSMRFVPSGNDTAVSLS